MLGLPHAFAEQVHLVGDALQQLGVDGDRPCGRGPSLQVLELVVDALVPIPAMHFRVLVAHRFPFLRESAMRQTMTAAAATRVKVTMCFMVRPFP